MATKKQKRLAMDLKRQRQAEETRQSGLRAQQRAREARERASKKRQEEAAAESARLEAILQAERTRLAMSNMAGAGCGD